MLRGYACQFRTDETGGGTIMGLLWFMLLVGLTGLAVDVTDGLRNRTMLQATADASALAAAIDLPDEAAAVATAVATTAASFRRSMAPASADASAVACSMVRLRKPSVTSTAMPVMPTSSMNHSRPNMVPPPVSSVRN